MLMNILLGLACAGAAYYFCSWIAARMQLGRMTYIEVRNAQIEEDMRTERASSRRDRLNATLSQLGYSGDWTPLLLGVSFVYLSLALALNLIGAGSLLGALLALPLAIVSSFAALANARQRQLAKFERQLLQVVTSVASYLESGDVPQMAFQKASRMIDDPLRSELERALASKVGSESLASAMKVLADKFPSRAMTLLVTALNIDDRVGAKLSPALRQAQKTLERQFELAAEANAEVSQARGEFYAISIIIALIGVMMIVASGASARGAYFSTGGLIVLGITAGNYSLGIFRARRVFRKAGRS